MGIGLGIGLGTGEARAQATPEDAAFSFLYVGLPIVDGAVFMGGITAALAGTVNIADGRSSRGWRTANYALGGLNAASTLGYVISMGSVRGAWPYLLWPMLAHAGLATANFVIGYKVGFERARLAAAPRRSVRLSLTPLLIPGRPQELMIGVGATLVSY
jgi:hypothetical protein